MCLALPFLYLSFTLCIYLFIHFIISLFKVQAYQARTIFSSFIFFLSIYSFYYLRCKLAMVRTIFCVYLPFVLCTGLFDYLFILAASVPWLALLPEHLTFFWGICLFYYSILLLCRCKRIMARTTARTFNFHFVFLSIVLFIYLFILLLRCKRIMARTTARTTRTCTSLETWSPPRWRYIYSHLHIFPKIS